MKLRLDSKTIATLALDEGQDEAFVWDSELAGFGIRLQGRRRTYIVQYRANGRTRRITLGSVERVTLTQAREAARKLLARVALGEDPQDEKAAKRRQAERTFRKVVEVYLAEKKRTLRPASYKVTKLYLTGPYFRLLHSRGIGEIEHPDIAARLSAITRKHSASTAAAARRHLSAMFTWAMEEGWIKQNPVVGTRNPGEAKKRTRILSDGELVAVWNACDGNDDFSRIVRQLILLGKRPQEIGGMRAGEFDLEAGTEAGTWELPEERSKNGYAHLIDLAPAALKIVRMAFPFGKRDHLFGARSARGFTEWAHGKAALDRRLGGKVKPWQLRDIRRTVATRMGDIKIHPHVIEAVLNHHSGYRAGVAGVYNRSPYRDEVKAALVRWSEHVLALVERRPDKIEERAGKVVALRA
jgi:integrase